MSKLTLFEMYTASKDKTIKCLSLNVDKLVEEVMNVHTKSFKL
jgi:hypothetical protein